MGVGLGYHVEVGLRWFLYPSIACYIGGYRWEYSLNLNHFVEGTSLKCRSRKGIWGGYLSLHYPCLRSNLTG